MKKTISILLSLILILSLFTIISVPASAWTTTTVGYLDLEGNGQTVQMVRQYNGETYLDGSMYAVTGSWTINSRIICTGNISFVLDNDVTLTALKGITVAQGSSLTIWQAPPEEGAEPGKLIVGEPEDNYAGIGSEPQGAGGTININGCTVTVTGGANAAGIGGTNSTVTINRGTVTATGGANAADIGGTNSTVTINGGAVNATGGSDAAGISGTIVLKNGEIPYGEVAVTSDSYSGALTLDVPFYDENGVCYPSGAVSDNSLLAGKTLKALLWNIPYIDENGAEQMLLQDDYTDITSSTDVLSTGWYVVREDTENNNRLTVRGSVNLLLCNGTTLTAHKGITVNSYNSLTIWEQKEDAASESGKLIVNQCVDDSAGIGGESGSGGNITINGGTVNVRGGTIGAGIGGGKNGSGGNITINGGNVRAVAGSNGAGIGGGRGGSGGNITINGGTVTATGGYMGAGIGGGGPVYSGGPGGESIDRIERFGDGGTIIISGGSITASSSNLGAGIGGGRYSNGGTIIISGGTVSVSDGSTGIGFGSGGRGGSVTLKWTGETKYDMSVYPRSCNVDVTLENGFKDGNGAVYAAGSYSGGTFSNKTLTPAFFDVTWVNDDGTVLETDEEVEGGTLPTYDGETPVKPADEFRSYAFSGWTPEVTEVVADAIYTAVFIGIGAFSGHSLTLDGDIGINFYVSLTDAQFARGAVVDFAWTVEGVEKTGSVTLTASDLTANGYKATCPVAVAEMTCDVNATLTVGGVLYDTDVYSVKDYADTILSDDYKTKYLAGDHTEEEYNKLATLVKAMLIYGAKAQIWFDRNLDDLADAGLVYTLTEVTPEMISPSARDMESGLDAYGLKYEGTTIVYLSKTSLRHYYTITDQAKFDLVKDSVMFDAEPVEYHTKDGKIYFEVTDIAAADLDTPYPLQIGTNIYSYTVLDYVRECLRSKYTPHQTWVLVCATYWYNQAADAYFG